MHGMTWVSFRGTAETRRLGKPRRPRKRQRPRQDQRQQAGTRMQRKQRMKGQRQQQLLSLWAWRESLDAGKPTKSCCCCTQLPFHPLDPLHPMRSWLLLTLSVASVASVLFRVQPLQFSRCPFVRCIRVIRTPLRHRCQRFGSASVVAGRSSCPFSRAIHVIRRGRRSQWSRIAGCVRCSARGAGSHSFAMGSTAVTSLPLR